MPRKTRRIDTPRRGKFTDLQEQLVAAIADSFVAEFKDSPEVAHKRAGLALGIIQSTAGGTSMYMAKGHLWHISEKHRQIYRRFTGGNHAALALEYGLTERQIYTIIAAISEEEFQRRQSRLFA